MKTTFALVLFAFSSLALANHEIEDLLWEIRHEVRQGYHSPATLEKAKNDLARVLSDLRHDGPIEVPPDLAQACVDSFDGSQNERECLQIARANRLSAEIVRTCEMIMDGDANELQCLRNVSLGVVLDTGRINLCESIMDGDANELECLAIVSRRNLGTSSINYCEQSGNGDSEELACLNSL